MKSYCDNSTGISTTKDEDELHRLMRKEMGQDRISIKPIGYRFLYDTEIV